MSTKRTLYVGGLDESVTREIVFNAFIPFGDILDVNLPLDPKTQLHRGFAFVEFELPEDATAAMENMNNAELYGRVLHVNLAQPQVLSAKKAIWTTEEWMEKNLKENAEQQQSSENGSTTAKKTDLKGKSAPQQLEQQQEQDDDEENDS